MKNMKYLPYIYRSIYRIIVAVVFVTMAISFVNSEIKSVKNTDELGQLKQAILLDTTNPRTHRQLAIFFEKHNDYPNAKREYLLAAAFGSTDAQLAYQRVLKKEQARQDVASALSIWQRFTNTHPTYRDGWMQVAAFSWMIGDGPQARAALEKALAIDPTNQQAHEFLNVLSN